MCKRSNYTQNSPQYEGDCEYRITSLKDVHIWIILVQDTSLLCLSQKKTCLDDKDLSCHHPTKIALKYNWSFIIHDKVNSDGELIVPENPSSS